jgi:hypothetical protein
VELLKDFHVLRPVIEAHREIRFSSDEEVIGAVQNWLKTQPKTVFFDGIKKLVNSWNRCVESRGITLKSDISFFTENFK